MLLKKERKIYSRFWSFRDMWCSRDAAGNGHVENSCVKISYIYGQLRRITSEIHVCAEAYDGVSHWMLHIVALHAERVLTLLLGYFLVAGSDQAFNIEHEWLRSAFWKRRCSVLINGEIYFYSFFSFVFVQEVGAKSWFKSGSLLALLAAVKLTLQFRL